MPETGRRGDFQVPQKGVGDSLGCPAAWALGSEMPRLSPFLLLPWKCLWGLTSLSQNGALLLLQGCPLLAALQQIFGKLRALGSLVKLLPFESQVGAVHENFSFIYLTLGPERWLSGLDHQNPVAPKSCQPTSSREQRGPGSAA